ncbi:7642_t:CDS:2 [Funneliformis caledonium]|uniref:Large ribosomal subunit protein mL53 n=2 Tax=Funneliformis TaxID=1117308 RepID=A0A9N8V8A6_9GLOM|nr:7642_t:CDS:2 [Funneliformis caledonium]CAG8469965.1 4091_t:CDS:2 [Funneliformis mosseae]
MLKYINQVDIKFAPFSPSAKSSRLFLARVMTDKARLANPGATINTTVLSDPNQDPTINIIYRDGKKLTLRPGNKNIDEVLYVVNKHLRRLKEEEDFAA